jgi:hypothetical protein
VRRAAGLRARACTDLWESIAAPSAPAEEPARREPTKTLTPSVRIRQIGSVVEDAWSRVAAIKIDVDVEAERIATDLVEGPDYVANNHSELAKLSSDDRCRLFVALKTNTNLLSVELANTGIDNAAARVLAQALGEGGNATLTALNIERNHVASEGIVALAEMIPQNKTLRELKLAYQFVTIGSQAEVELAEALEHNTTLTKLTLDARQVRVRELRDKWLMRNANLRREQQRMAAAAAASGGAGAET